MDSVECDLSAGNVSYLLAALWLLVLATFK